MTTTASSTLNCRCPQIPRQHGQRPCSPDSRCALPQIGLSHEQRSWTLLSRPTTKLPLQPKAHPSTWSPSPKQNCKTHHQKCAGRGSPRLPQDPVLKWAAPTRITTAEQEVAGRALQGTPSPSPASSISRQGLGMSKKPGPPGVVIQVFNPST